MWYKNGHLGLWAGQVHLNTSVVDQGQGEAICLTPSHGQEGSTSLSFLWSYFLQVGSCLLKVLSRERVPLGGLQDHSPLLGFYLTSRYFSPRGTEGGH